MERHVRPLHLGKPGDKQIRTDKITVVNLIPQLNVGVKEFPTLRIVVTPAWSAVSALRFMRFSKRFCRIWYSGFDYMQNSTCLHLPRG